MENRWSNMRKVILAVLFLGLTFNFCYAQEQIIDYSENSLPILNNELRSKDVQINNLSGNLASTTTVARTKYIYFVIPDDTLTTGADKIGRIYVNFAGTIQAVHASVKTAPTGADIIVDLNLNGSTIWSTQANRVTIAATANTGIQTSFNTATFASGDYFTIDIDQIGSTIAGAKLVVRLKLLQS